jgi:uncharacterized protein (TIGR03435 family)
MDAVAEHARAGGPVVGICNGFQVLTEAGLLPGALQKNAGLKFLCQPADLRVETVTTVLTNQATVGQILRIPVNHFEGNYVCDDRTLDALRAEERVVVRYVANPNGARDDIAGICNEARNVVGLMPHPERASDTLLGSTDGLVMLQSLLEERFKLKAHRETRDLPVYVMTVAKGGLKLQPSAEGSCLVIDPRNPPRPAASGQQRLPGCGNNQVRSNTWNASSVDMTSVAGALVAALNRSVVDKTGVSGKFDIHVQWTPDQAPAGVDSAAPDNSVSLFTVLEDQLGLKVESARGPVDVLVIDHIERPTGD